MTIAIRLVILLLAPMAALPLVAYPPAQGLAMLWTALAAAVVGFAVKPGEAIHLARVVRPLAFITAVPALWMLLQLVPLPVPGLANPIWASAVEALGAAIPGHVTIDVGETTRVLLAYLFVVTVALVMAALAIDRQRAEQGLYVLVFITTVMALTIIVHDLAGLTFMGEIDQSPRLAFDTAATLGVVLAPAVAQLSIERYETRGRQTQIGVPKLIEGFTIALISFSLCGFALTYFSPTHLPVAALCGIGVYLLVTLIRRLGLGRWLSAVLVGAVLIAAGMVFGQSLGARSGDLTLRFASASQSERLGVERMIADSPPVGTGGGTYPILREVYQGGEERPLPAPSAAARLTVEFGRFAALVCLGLALALAALLLRGALQRGRDSFYAAAAASSLIAMVVLSFQTAGPLEPTSAVLIAACVGLGFAQVASRPLS